MINVVCPKCSSHDVIKNGHIASGKQNHRCLMCGQSFVENPEWRPISEEMREQIKRSLVERASLRGICRIFKVSMTWLLGFVATIYGELPDHLNIWLPQTLSSENSRLQIFCEADEVWSFVRTKENPYWIWLVMDVQTRQIVACHVGGRKKVDAQALWNAIPDVYRSNGYFYTDFLKSYEAIFAEEQHSPVGKETGLTNHIERFNCTLRQRLSRLVRDNLAFSKKILNHIGAIKHFICEYNAEIISRRFSVI
jgi:insertion element IS1 protein InsB